ncbi:hypothetical protein NFI96_029336, partial [Prochilodus magdalenae]
QLPLRLSGGTGRCSGRLEVYHNAEWGSVCDDLWDIKDAQVVCRQLDCGPALSANGSSLFGAGSGTVWLKRVKCRGNETHLWDCPHSLKNHTDCSHRQHAGVTCTDMSVSSAPPLISDTISTTTVGQPVKRSNTLLQTLPPAIPSIYPGSLLVLGAVLLLTLVLLVVLLYQNRRLRRVLSKKRETLIYEGLRRGLEGVYEGLGRGTERVYEEILCRFSTARDTQRGSIVSEAQPSGYEDVDEDLLSGSIVSEAQHSGYEDVDEELLSGESAKEDPAESYDDVFTAGQISDGAADYDDVEEEPQTEMNYVMKWRTHTQRASSGNHTQISSNSRNDLVLDHNSMRVSSVQKIEDGVFHSHLLPVRKLQWVLSMVDLRMNYYRLFEVSTERVYLLPNGDLYIDRRPVIIPPGLPHSLVDPPVCLGPFDAVVTGEGDLIFSEEILDLLEAVPGILSLAQEMGVSTSSEQDASTPAPSTTNKPLAPSKVKYLQSLWGRGGEACSAAELNGLRAGQREMDSCVVLILLSYTVTLSTAVSVRLVDGGSRCAGRVEVNRNGQWGTVCGYGWDMTDAGVVCRELGCGEAQGIPKFGPGSGPILMGYVRCRGSESALNSCRFNSYYGRFCTSHNQDVGVTCSGDKPRLTDGPHECSGRLEVPKWNKWYTVCDADFDQQDAEVVCRELGCGLPVEVLGGAAFGRGEGQVWSEELQCRGDESQIYSCPTSSSLKHNCSHDSDVGLVCSGYTGARMVNGFDSCAGRVELQYLSEWGTVCDVSWDMRAASVLCGQLKCGAVAVVGSDWFGEGSGRIWADVFDCQGNETHLSQCPISSWSRTACSHKQDAGVICSGSSLALHEGRVRLSGGMECEGKVEVYFRQDWRRVLLDSWSKFNLAHRSIRFMVGFWRRGKTVAGRMLEVFPQWLMGN